MARQKKLALGAVALASTFSTMAYGSGFALIEQSVTGLGRAFSGSAAVADNANTIFFNPAGLSYLDRAELDIGVNYLGPRGNFRNNNSVLPDFDGPGPYTTQALTGGTGGDALENAFLPNLYYARPLNDKTVFGLGITAPFGLVTEYQDDWMGRYQAIKSDLKTVDINPSLAFKPNEKLSLGFGISAQYIDLELTQAVDFGSICYATMINPATPAPLAAAAAPCAGPQGNDGRAKITADDWSWGYNFGAIFQATEATRIAFSYRSKISHELKGKGEFSTPSNAQTVASALGFNNASVSGKVTLPETASLAFHHQLNDKVAIMGDATWTRWNRFQELTVVSSDPANKLNSSKEENWENTMRYGLGLDYSYNERWTFRTGIAFDETPMSLQYRTARVPDEDRKWFSLGASYKVSDQISIDAGYSHLFVRKADINETLSPIPHTLNGDYDNSVNIFGMQLRWFI